MLTLFRHLRYSLRQLLKHPSFCLTVVLSLAFGVGGTVAVFSLTDAILLRPLQFTNEARLVQVFENRPALGLTDDTPAPANYMDWKRRNHVFTDMAASGGTIYTITGNGRPEQVEGTVMTANLLPLLGISPLIGRNFRSEEDQPGAKPVALISAGLWQRRFGSDPHILGKTIRLDGVPHTILGVMPFGFTFYYNAEIWTPLALSPAKLLDRDNHFLLVYGLLRPKVTVEDARRDLSALSSQLQREYPASNTGLFTSVTPLREQLVGKTRAAIFVLAAGILIILLTTCVNIAGLMIARSMARNRELAIKTALGATTFALFYERLSESALLALIGGVAGVMFAGASMPLLGNLVPLTLAAWAHPEVNWHALLFALMTCLLASISFAFAGHRFVARYADSALRAGRGALNADRRLIRSILVTIQIALATVVLIATGLLGQTFWKLAHANLGFTPEHVLTVRTDLPVSSLSPYRDFNVRSSFYTRVIERVERIPGVISAGYTTFLPLTNGGGSSTVVVEGAPPSKVGELNNILMRIITPDYFRAMGIPLISGRLLTLRENNAQPARAVINQAMARKFWPGQDPVGRRFRFDDPHSPVITVAGVVGDVRQEAIQSPPSAEMYFSYLQDIGIPGYFRPRDLAVRVTGDPGRYIHSVRNVIWSVDPEEPVSTVQTLQRIVDDRLATYDIEAKLFGWFAIGSLVLSSIGVYGLLSYDVAQRTREIGLRMALGAERGEVLRRIVGLALRLAMIGMLAGAILSFAFTGVMRSLLYGVAGWDIPSRALAAMVVLFVALLAAYLPAQRAASIEPLEALRAE